MTAALTRATELRHVLHRAVDAALAAGDALDMRDAEALRRALAALAAHAEAAQQLAALD